MLKLNDEDGRAVDLFLETRAHLQGHPQSGVHRAHSARVREKLEAVAALMDQLGNMPAAEPPASLLARTLAAVEARRADAPAVVPSDRPAAATRIHA